MKRLTFLLTTLSVVLALFSFRTDLKTDSYIGYAYEEGTKNLIYTEEFTDTFVNGKHIETVTQYFDPKHTLIAERKLNFTQSKYAPDFLTEDVRTGYREGATVSGNTVKLFVRKDKNSHQEEKTFTIPNPMVVDGGFNQFIKTNWNKLKAGENIVFHFTVPAKLDYYTLRVSKMDLRDSTLTLKIEPDKAVLRWLTSQIIIVYNTDTKRIISYEGKSNIADKNGNNFITKLIYPDKGP